MTTAHLTTVGSPSAQPSRPGVDEDLLGERIEHLDEQMWCSRNVDDFAVNRAARRRDPVFRVAVTGAGAGHPGTR